MKGPAELKGGDPVMHGFTFGIRGMRALSIAPRSVMLLALCVCSCMFVGDANAKGRLVTASIAPWGEISVAKSAPNNAMMRRGAGVKNQSQHHGMQEREGEEGTKQVVNASPTTAMKTHSVKSRAEQLVELHDGTTVRWGSRQVLECPKDTGGTCIFWSCDESHNAECSSTKCVCPEGSCVHEGKCFQRIAVDGYIALNGDCSGSDLDSESDLAGLTESECADACDKLPECVGFSYHPSGVGKSGCIPKSEVCEFPAHNGWTFYEMEAAAQEERRKQIEEINEEKRRKILMKAYAYRTADPRAVVLRNVLVIWCAKLCLHR